MTILVAKRMAYVRGNAIGLRNGGDLSPRQASRYARRWISVPHGEFDFSMLAEDVTLGSFLHNRFPDGRLVVVAGEIGGEKVVGVRGVGTTSTRTLYVRSANRPLPVAATMVVPAQGYRERATTDRWGEPVEVHAPADAVPMAKVLGIS